MPTYNFYIEPESGHGLALLDTQSVMLVLKFRTYFSNLLQVFLKVVASISKSCCKFFSGSKVVSLANIGKIVR